MLYLILLTLTTPYELLLTTLISQNDSLSVQRQIPHINTPKYFTQQNYFAQPNNIAHFRQLGRGFTFRFKRTQFNDLPGAQNKWINPRRENENLPWMLPAPRWVDIPGGLPYSTPSSETLLPPSSQIILPRKCSVC